MNSNRKKIVLLIIGVGTIVGSLFFYYRKQLSLLSNYKANIVKLKIKDIKADAITIIVSMLFTSESDIEATVTNLYLDFALNGHNVGYISETKPFLIPAHGTSNIDLTFTFNPKIVLNNAIDLFAKGIASNDITFKIDGYGKVQSNFITTTLPLQYSSTLKELMA